MLGEIHLYSAVKWGMWMMQVTITGLVLVVFFLLGDSSIQSCEVGNVDDAGDDN